MEKWGFPRKNIMGQSALLITASLNTCIVEKRENTITINSTHI